MNAVLQLEEQREAEATSLDLRRNVGFLRSTSGRCINLVFEQYLRRTFVDEHFCPDDTFLVRHEHTKYVSTARSLRVSLIHSGHS